MKQRLSGTQGRFTAAALGALATVLVFTAVGSSAPIGLTGGSLPLAGDKMPSGDGAPVDGHVSGSGSHWNVLNWGPGMLAAVPTSYSHPIVNDAGRTVSKVFVGTQANADVGSAESINNLSYSEDSGLSFLTTRRDMPVSALNMTRLADGSLISIEFIPDYVDLAERVMRLKVWRSPDGVSWTKQAGGDIIFPDGKIPTGMRAHRRIIVEPDGTLLLPVYGSFQGSSKGYSAILQSSDTGVSWTYRSVIPATNTPGVNEVGFAYTSDNRLMAVMRTTHTPAQLVYSYSDDHGKTWTEAADLLGPDGKPVVGIYPDLVLQPNGTLLLTTGRPDVRYLVSYDGTGKSWHASETIFANYPSTGNNGRYDGSSGNNTMENVGANRSVLYYDQCHVWGCGAYNEQFGVSAEYVGALTPGAGRIDVMSKLLDGTAKVAGSFGKGDKNFPEQRPEGAFDGSSAPMAAAKLLGKNGKAGELTLTLDRTYYLNRLGLMLGNGDPQSATVQLSVDGKTWSDPVVDAADRIDRAMRYVDFRPQPARYVRVTGGPGSTAVTELELYTTGLDTFENELPFAIPRGWTEATHAWVTDVPSNVAYTEFGGYHSTTALRLWDKWTDDNARIIRPTEPTDHLYGSMQFGAQDYRARFTFGTRGTATDGSDVDAWKFRLSQGSPAKLDAFDGTSWVNVGSLKSTLPSREYLPLSIDATTSEATVTIGGNRFTTTVRAAEATDVHSLSFATGDPAEYGGAYYLDDVAVSTDPGAEPTLGEVSVEPISATAGQPFTVSTTVTNSGDKPATDLSATLSTPDGWQVQPIDHPTELAAGAAADISWQVTTPADIAPGSYRVGLSASYQSGGAYLSAVAPSTVISVGVLPQSRMTATATSEHNTTTLAAANAIDTDPATLWHSRYSPVKDVPPQSITLDLGGSYTVSGVLYEPRKDNSTNGMISAYNVYVSTDGTTFTKVTSGQWAVDRSTKNATFSAVPGVKAVRLEATAAANDYVSAAEINITGTVN